MQSLSTPHPDLGTQLPSPATTPAGTREIISAIVVLGLLLAAIATAVVSQSRSRPVAGEDGPEASLVITD